MWVLLFEMAKLYPIKLPIGHSCGRILSDENSVDYSLYGCLSQLPWGVIC